VVGVHLRTIAFCNNKSAFSEHNSFLSMAKQTLWEV